MKTERRDKAVKLTRRIFAGDKMVSRIKFEVIEVVTRKADDGPKFFVDDTAVLLLLLFSFSPNFCYVALCDAS